MGYGRDDSPPALEAMNAPVPPRAPALPAPLPAVGHARPERVLASPDADPGQVAQRTALRARLDPFALSQAIDQERARLYSLAHPRHRPRPTTRPRPLSGVEQASLQALAQGFGIPVSVGTQSLGGRR
jgi:hypothetical protein